MNDLCHMPAGYRGALRPTCASKVREWPDQPNGFSLPATREVCLYATPTCWQGCYAKRGRMAFPTPQRLFSRNYNALVNAGGAERMAELLTKMLESLAFRIFRIHVSGDFFSAAYAQAWALVCDEFRKARFWTYTRSRDPDVLAALHKVRNLRMLLSCDQDNWQEMLALSREFPCYGLSYYSVGEWPPRSVYERAERVPVGQSAGLVVFPDRQVQRRVCMPGTCPTETGRHAWRKAEACVRCRRCCG